MCKALFWGLNKYQTHLTSQNFYKVVTIIIQILQMRKPRHLREIKKHVHGYTKWVNGRAGIQTQVVGF